MNNDLLGAIFNAALDAMVVVDNDRNLVLANPAACEIFGLSLEEMLKRNLFDFVPEDDKNAARELWDEFLRVGQQGGEMGMRRADGRDIDVEYRATANIAPGRHLSILRPITARREAEAAQTHLQTLFRDHKNRLEGILASVPGVVWEAWGEPDMASQRINFVSNYVETMLGYSTEEWLSTPNFWLTIVHPDDRESAARVAAQAFVGDQTHNNTFRWITKDGRALWVEAHSVTISDENGKAVGMRGVTMDISARTQAQDALKFSEERFRLLFDQSTMSMQILDPGGKTVRVNRAWEELWGVTLSHLEGYNMLEDQQLIEKGVMPFLLKAFEGTPSKLPEIYYNPDATLKLPGARARWTRAVAYPLVNDGQVSEIVLLHEDITEWKRVQLNLQFLLEASEGLTGSLDYEETLKNLAEFAVPAFADYCVVDIFEGESLRHVKLAHRDPAKIQFVLEIEEKFPLAMDAPMGAPRVRITGKPEMAAEIDPEMTAAFAHNAEHLALLRQLDLKSYITVPLYAHGQIRGAITWVREQSSPSYTDTDFELACDLGRRAGVAIENALLYRRATEALAAAEAANRAKDEFLAVVSHELRTPLNAISGWAALLRHHSIDEDTTAQALEIIERNCNVQTKLVEDILEISRIVGGTVKLEIKPVELASLIEASVATLSSTAAAKSIRISVGLQPTLLVNGDEVRLQQIVTNLLTNAIKFTPENGRIEVKLGKRDAYAEFCVIDSGEGIAPEFLPYVFERFRQADGSSTRHYGGLGLGLAIVRHLVELHGGTITAESQGAGQGAEFTVRLPLLGRPAVKTSGILPTRSLQQVIIESAPENARTLAEMKILVVDDEADACYLTRLWLESLGAIVTTAMSARAAMELLAVKEFDVLISDIAMPEVSGYDLIQQIRRAQPPVKTDIPAIALTAFAGIEEREKALKSGFDIHLGKPVTAEELMRVVARYKPA